jgi:hypothetical protein
MKDPRTVAKRIAELHNEGVKFSVKRAEDAKRSAEEPNTIGEKVIRLVEDAVEDASARTTEEAVELGHKLLDFAHINASAYFDWLHEIVRVKSPSEFIAVCMKHSQQQMENFRQQSREIAGLAQKAAIENTGPVGLVFGNALIGRPDLC